MKKIRIVLVLVCLLVFPVAVVIWASINNLISVWDEVIPNNSVVSNPKIYFNSADFLENEWKYCFRATDGCNTFEVVNWKLWNSTEMYCENVYWKNGKESWSCIEYQFPSICTNVYSPVCWDDGVTYSNPCLASEKTQIAYIWECKSFNWNACSEEYAPVCWKDWVTYGNICKAGSVWIDYQGECKKVCSEEYAPVCWVDWVTYQNDCKIWDIKISYYWPCKITCNDDYNPVCWINWETYQNPCKAWNVPIDYYWPCLPCWTKFEPVCWVNGVTYENECRANNAWVAIAYYGACTYISVEPCTEEYRPVCWINWVTYPNACKAKNRWVDIAYYSECSYSVPVCPLNISPVCWVNGKTYDNACLASSVKVAYTGKCATPINACTNIYAPVCWINGITYDNECKAWKIMILYTWKCNTNIYDDIDFKYIDEKLLVSLEKSESLIQSKLKNISISVLERAVIILDGEIEKRKIWVLTDSKKKIITQYTFIKNVIKKELRERL
jgi:hypothetical protein